MSNSSYDNYIKVIESGSKNKKYDDKYFEAKRALEKTHITKPIDERPNNNKRPNDDERPNNNKRPNVEKPNPEVALQSNPN